MNSDSSWQGQNARLHGTSTIAWIVTKRSRISLTADRLIRYNAGTEPVLYSGKTLFIQDLSWLGLDDEYSLKFHIESAFSDQAFLLAERVFVV